MKHMKRSYAFITLAMLAVFVTITACERGSVGIFASLEREELIKKGNLPENAAVTGMVRVVPAGGGSAKYYASLGSVFTREAGAKDSPNWDRIDAPGAMGDGSNALDIASIDPDGSGGAAPEVYVSFGDVDGTDFGLFRLETGNDSWTNTGYDRGQVVELISVDANQDDVDDELYAVTKDGENYDLVYQPQQEDPDGDGGGYGEVVIDNATRIVDGTWDRAGSRYVFITRTDIYTGGSGGGNAPSLSGQPASNFDSTFDASENLAGILYDPGAGSDRPGGLYIASAKGVIYFNDGSGWTKSNRTSSSAYTDLAVFPQLDGTETGGGVVVGLSNTDQDADTGYRELPGCTVDTIEDPSGNNYLSGDISDVTVSGFFADRNTDPNLLFAFTEGRGLWRARYADKNGNLQQDPFWSWE
jgi:hypothetical protein